MGSRILRQRLFERINAQGVKLHNGNNLVAFSGGVDSSVVAYAVHHLFPQNTLCILGLSASLPSEQLTLARKVAEHIGTKLIEVETKEGDSEQYIKNEGMSCYSCKTHLYSALNAVIGHTQENHSIFVQQQQQQHHNQHQRQSYVSSVTVETIRSSDDHLHMAGEPQRVVLFNGTNKDDLSDPTRVGLIAAKDFQVYSPLDEFSKAEVRALAKEFELFNHDYAASPCLRSRLAFGVSATPANLKRIEDAERLVRSGLSIAVTQNLRVRHIQGGRPASSPAPINTAPAARIELDALFLQRLSDSPEGSELLREVAERVGSLGFSSVSIQPFRSGSVAATTTSLPAREKQR